MSLIDICIPTCNSNPAYLQQTIDNVLAQTETRWRMYIHDDASTTDVFVIIEPYLNDPRISWHPNRKKLGIGGNWNATMKLGASPYVQFLFQDDWWEPTFLEQALKVMEQHPSVGMVSLEHRYVGDGGTQSLSLYEYPATFRKEELKPGLHDGKETLRWWVTRGLHPNIVGEPDFVMLRRSVVEKAGWYLEDMQQNLDVEFALRCLLHGDWYYIPQILGSFRVHPASVSETNQREGIGIFDRFRCFEELLKHTSGPDRDVVIQSRNEALTDMAKKFLNRMKSGGQVKTGGSGAFKKFAIQHPLLVMRALWGAWSTTKN